jgi:hypothetical protein
MVTDHVGKMVIAHVGEERVGIDPLEFVAVKDSLIDNMENKLSAVVGLADVGKDPLETLTGKPSLLKAVVPMITTLVGVAALGKDPLQVLTRKRNYKDTFNSESGFTRNEDEKLLIMDSHDEYQASECDILPSGRDCKTNHEEQGSSNESEQTSEDAEDPKDPDYSGQSSTAPTVEGDDDDKDSLEPLETNQSFVKDDTLMVTSIVVGVVGVGQDPLGAGREKRKYHDRDNKHERERYCDLEGRSMFDNRWMEEFEEGARIKCARCNISTSMNASLMVPTAVNVLDFFRCKPNTLTTAFPGCRKLSVTDRTQLLQWTYSLMEVAVVLLCHTFHADFIQCGVITDQQAPNVVVLDSNIDTVLVIALRNNHYALIELDLAESVVTVWESLNTTLIVWRDMVLKILRQYCPQKIDPDAKNVVFTGEVRKVTRTQKSRKVKRYQPPTRWRVELKAPFKQNNTYDCGPISLNRLASRLEARTKLSQSLNEVNATLLSPRTRIWISDEIMDLIQKPEILADNNAVNAVTMVQHLLRMNLNGTLFRWWEDDDDDDGNNDDAQGCSWQTNNMQEIESHLESLAEKNKQNDNEGSGLPYQSRQIRPEITVDSDRGFQSSEDEILPPMDSNDESHLSVHNKFRNSKSTREEEGSSDESEPSSEDADDPKDPDYSEHSTASETGEEKDTGEGILKYNFLKGINDEKPAMASSCDENLDEELKFPTALDIKSLPGGALSSLRCTLDVDSLYLTARHPSDILEFLGSNGTAVEFHSAVCRTQTSSSCRLSINYGGCPDQRPAIIGKKLSKTCKKIGFDNFPNVLLCKVRKGVISFYVQLYLIKPTYIRDNSCISHEILLTLLAALNCATNAIIAHVPVAGVADIWTSEGAYGGLNSFELQSNSREGRKNIYSSHKAISGEDAKILLSRLECVLRMMSTEPGLIDSARQEEQTGDGYWKFRQMISAGGDGEFVPLEKMKVNAGILLHRVMYVASAAGIKDIYVFENQKAIFDGPVEASIANGDPDVLHQRFSRFKEEQFVRIKRSLLDLFPGLHASHRLFQSCNFLFDLGINCRPWFDGHHFCASLGAGKRLLRECIRGSVPDDATVESVESADSTPRATPPAWTHDNEGEEASMDDVSAGESSFDEYVGDDLDAGSGVEELQPEDDDDLGETNEEVQFWRRLSETVKVTFMTFPKHHNLTVGNIHGGKIDLCPYDENGLVDVNDTAGALDPPEEIDTPEEDWINLCHPGIVHLLNGQMYETFLRLEEMAQTRPHRDSVYSLLAHVINLCCNGGYIFGCGITDSMRVVKRILPILSQTFHHRRERRNSLHSPNVVRIEIFLAWNMKNDAGQMVTISHLPNIDPTVCIECFDKKALNHFEDEFVKSHLEPIEKLLGKMSHLLEVGRNTDYQRQFSAPLRTRLLASLEILIYSADDSLGRRGVIQKQMYAMLDEGCVSMDIPHKVRVVLSVEERQRSGFRYGVLPIMFCLHDNSMVPTPPYLSQVGSEHLLSSHFPKYYSTLDCLLCRSLCHHSIDVGMIERGKAMIRCIINSICDYVLREEEDGISDISRITPDFGVMEVPDYAVLLRCSAKVRIHMFSMMARLMIISVCQCMHKQLVKDGVFGSNHGLPTEAVDGTTNGLSLAFKDFPFVMDKVKQYTDKLGDKTLFLQKGNAITSTGNVLNS